MGPGGFLWVRDILQYGVASLHVPSVPLVIILLFADGSALFQDGKDLFIGHGDEDDHRHFDHSLTIKQSWQQWSSQHQTMSFWRVVFHTSTSIPDPCKSVPRSTRAALLAHCCSAASTDNLCGFFL